ncbi:MAG TPA: ABC transporter permease [Bryobacteraceae bacterium]
MFGQDIRFGIRSLIQSPGYALTAVLSLALGIAATTAIFSVIYGVIIDPFPYSHPETLMSIQIREPDHHLVFSPYTPDQYLDIAEHNKIFNGVIASTISDVLLSGKGNPERLRGNFVTTNTFDVMGVKPYLGRYIRPSDGGVEASPVAVLGYKFWRKHFGGDAGVIGTSLRLNDKVRTIVGVMPPRFMWRGADVYLPIVFQRGKVVEGVRYINVIGRLKPGVTAAEADTDLHPIIEDILLRRDPAYHHQKFQVKLYNFYETYPNSIRKQLWILLSAVSLLLLIACANVSNLMLARAAARSREIAIRAALGAGRLRIARQLLTESLLLGFGAALLGIGLAFAMLQAVVAIIPPGTIPDESKVSLNIPVLLFTLALSLFIALLFGIAPAFQAARADLAGTLRNAGRGFAGNLQEARLRKVLVAGEVSLALLLLVGASLVVRTLIKLQNVNLGYHPSEVLSMQIPLPESHYRTIDSRNQFLSTIVSRIKTVPGLEDIALNTFVHPFANWGMHVDVPGSPVHQERIAIFSQINSSYPAILHIPLKEGRFFSAQEVEMKRHVALINATFAHTYFADASPVGRVFRLPELKGEPINLADDTFTIVGVVGDLRNVGLEKEVYPEVYVPYTITGYMEDFIHPTVLVTAKIPPQDLAAAITQQIHAVDPDQPVMQVESVEKLLDNEGFAGPRFSVFLFSVFAGLGLIICAIGIYGVVNYSVSRQMQALGIRVALGANRKNILGLVFGEALRLILWGVIVGVICGLVATRWLSALIWGVSPSDPISFIVVTLVLFFAGLAACVRPAWRASHADPTLVLRQE